MKILTIINRMFNSASLIPSRFEFVFPGHVFSLLHYSCQVALFLASWSFLSETEVFSLLSLLSGMDDVDDDLERLIWEFSLLIGAGIDGTAKTSLFFEVLEILRSVVEPEFERTLVTEQDNDLASLKIYYHNRNNNSFLDPQSLLILSAVSLI